MTARARPRGVRAELPTWPAVTPVKRWMRTGVVTVSPATTVGEAARLMTTRGVRHLPVREPSGPLLGIITDRDLRQVVFDPAARARLGPDATAGLDEIPVREVMTWGVVTVRPADDVRHAAPSRHEHPDPLHWTRLLGPGGERREQAQDEGGERCGGEERYGPPVAWGMEGRWRRLDITTGGRPSAAVSRRGERMRAGGLLDCGVAPAVSLQLPRLTPARSSRSRRAPASWTSSFRGTSWPRW